MPQTGPSGGKSEGETSFLAVKTELEALALPHVQPFADPHSAAVTALLVAEYLSKDDLASKVEALGKAGAFDAEKVGRLRTLSRALLHLMNQLGGDWFPEVKASDVGELRGKGAGLRDKMMDIADKRLHDPAARQWIDAIRKGAGDVDLLIDLRSTAHLYETYAEELSKDPAYDKSDREAATKLADSLEEALTKHEDKDKKACRKLIVAAWTLFIPVYDDVCRAGRFVAADDPRVSAMFPILPSISRARRQAARRSFSTGSMRAVDVAAAARTSVKPPAEEKAPDEERAPSAPPPSSRRIEPRVPVEMELGLMSQSNFYQGFTENLSASGVFVATYVLEPIGTKVSIKLDLPTGERLELLGVVRWIRTASAADDAWPGMGIQFEAVTPEQEKKIRSFLKFREPLFFDDELAT